MAFKDSVRLRFGCLIIKDSKVLAVKDSRYYLFTLPGGKIEEGEAIEECFSRELKEELNCKFVSAKFFGAYYDKEGEIDRINAVFIVEVKGEPKASSEIEKIEWLSSKDLEKFGPGTARIIKDTIAARLIK